MNDDLTTLASSYLDGDATPDERARVESDAAALAEVERLRQVRAVLAQVDPAPISTRERHLAAALDVWDRLPTSEFGDDATPAGSESAAAAGRASITAPTSLGDRRKQRVNSRVLTIAAALVIVVGGGIVASGFIGSDDSDDVNVASDAASPVDDDVSARAELEIAAAEEAFDADEAPAEASAAEPPAAPEADTLTGGESEGAPDADLEVLSNEAELAVFANDLLDAASVAADDGATQAIEPDAGVADESGQADASDADTADTTAPALSTLPPPAPLCDLVTRIVGPALWETPGIFDEVVIVGIDDATGDAVAYREEDCSVVARTSL